MNRTEKKLSRRKQIKYRIRKRIFGVLNRPRLSVFRSNTGMYAQIIDDQTGKTLVSASSVGLDKKKYSVNIMTCEQVGTILAERAIVAGISEVVFDRNGYLYHGKVKAVADAARLGGLKF